MTSGVYIRTKEHGEKISKALLSKNRGGRDEKKWRTSDIYKAKRRKRYKEDIEFRKKEQEYRKVYRQSEKSKKWKREYSKNYVKKKLASDPIFKLAKTLRDRLRNLLYYKHKIGSSVRDLGCTVPELKIHLEKQFKAGMTWKNHGRYGWHIDHITPLSSFDLTDREQFLKACHYTNLQPLWAKENFAKGAKITNNLHESYR